MSSIDLGPRPDDPSLLASWYRSALALQARSRLSVAAFAERIGVSPATLYLWRRRQEAEQRVSPASSKRPSDGDAQLLQVRIAVDPARSADPLTVQLGNGIAIEVPSSFDPDALRQLVGVLHGC